MKFKTYKVFAFFQHYFSDKEYGYIMGKVNAETKEEDVKKEILSRMTTAGYYSIRIVSIEPVKE